MFASEKGVRIEEIKDVLAEVGSTIELEEIDHLLSAIAEKYSSEEFPYELQEIAGYFLFMTKPSYQDLIQSMLKQKQRKKLSKTVMETLAIIVYKQPVSKAEVEQIRGVNCDYGIQRLLEKDLISIVGRSEGPGKPMLYGTSEKFMDHFGLKSVDDLPKLRDIENAVNEIGKQERIAEQAIQTSSDN